MLFHHNGRPLAHVGDEHPRVRPPPSRRSSRSRPARRRYVPPQTNNEADEHEQRLIDLLTQHCHAFGIAWPHQRHRGRWRMLNHLMERGTLKQWVRDHPQLFNIVEGARQPLGDPTGGRGRNGGGACGRERIKWGGACGRERIKWGGVCGH